MKLDWIHESPACWDAHKAKIIGGAEAGVFRSFDWKEGAVIPGEWWRVEADGKPVGYGWMEIDWVEAEVLVAVDRDAQDHGIGSYILARLAREANDRGINQLGNVVRESHPQRDSVMSWLNARGFVHLRDDERLVLRMNPSRERDTAKP